MPVFFLGRIFRLFQIVLMGSRRLGADGDANAALRERGAMGVDVEGRRQVVSGADGERVIDAARRAVRCYRVLGYSVTRQGGVGRTAGANVRMRSLMMSSRLMHASPEPGIITITHCSRHVNCLVRGYEDSGRLRPAVQLVQQTGVGGPAGGAPSPGRADRRASLGGRMSGALRRRGLLIGCGFPPRRAAAAYQTYQTASG